MKRTLAAMLAALMLLTFLPLASQPARAEEVTFDVHCSVDHAYVGEVIIWNIVQTEDGQGGSGSFEYAFDLYRDGSLLLQGSFSSSELMQYNFTSPGKYMVKAQARNTATGAIYEFSGTDINVTASLSRITKVEPLSATSLRITWNTVPGANKYYLFRSTNMKNWILVKETTATSFTDTSLKPGTRYFYKANYRRRGVVGCTRSPAAAGVPMAKTRITSITSPSARRIRMTWAKAAGASGYQVAMATSPTGNYKTARIVTGGTTAIFSGVRSGSALFFKVRPYRRIYTTTYWGQYNAYRSVRVK
ncbi:MAG: fibronectin type III domain-containing protein [Bacillota bacterium]|nr:fibronectin type III domain-containing protein [Bacillota bacterium]